MVAVVRHFARLLQCSIAECIAFDRKLNMRIHLIPRPGRPQSDGQRTQQVRRSQLTAAEMAMWCLICCLLAALIFLGASYEMLTNFGNGVL